MCSTLKFASTSLSRGLKDMNVYVACEWAVSSASYCKYLGSTRKYVDSGREKDRKEKILTEM